MQVETILSALFAGLVAIGATLAIEKFGGKIGGVLGSMPTTIIPASIGFWYGSESVSIFQVAVFAVPTGMMVNAVFLYSWRILPPRLSPFILWKRLLAMALISLLIWAGFAYVFVLLIDQFSTAIFQLGCVSFALMMTFSVVACWKNPPAPKGQRKVGLIMILSRGVLAGLAIGCSVWMASIGVPVLAGMASVFPAIFLTTMVSIWLSQGEAVQAGAVGSMMLGSGSVSVYALIVGFSIPNYGVLLGSIIAWLGAVLFVSLPAIYFVRR